MKKVFLLMVVSAMQVTLGFAQTPDAGNATNPANRVGSLPLLISCVVLVIVLGTMVPLIGRWRKRKLLERNGAENLSFTNDESAGDIGNEVIAKPSSPDKDKPTANKVA